MKKCTQNYDSIDIIERVFCIYDQNYPILRGQFFALNSFNPLDCAINSRFKSVTHLVILTHHGDFWYCDLYHNIRKKASPSLPNSDQNSSNVFVRPI